MIAQPKGAILDYQKPITNLIEFLEEKTAENIALKTVLECVADLPDWKEHVETTRILVSGKVHDRFAPLRALFLASPDENQLLGDLDSVVRRLLDTALKPDDPAQP
jgi:hypothetical protein